MRIKDALLIAALNKFTNIDGAYGRNMIPLPYDMFHVAEATHLDDLSAQDRIDEIAPGACRRRILRPAM
jgi:hypothetical protein